MLTLTETASTAVRTITERAPGADNGGLRIAGSGEPGTDFAVTVAPGPQPEDAVVENAGARVFLAQDAAVALDNKVLDAQIESGGAVRFAIANQG